MANTGEGLVIQNKVRLSDPEAQTYMFKSSVLMLVHRVTFSISLLLKSRSNFLNS